MKRGIARAWLGGTALGLVLGSLVIAKLGSRVADDTQRARPRDGKPAATPAEPAKRRARSASAPRGNGSRSMH